VAGVWRRPLRALWCGTVPYQTAWEWQRRLAGARAQGELEDDLLLLMEHPAVYTMGRGGKPEHLLQGEAGLRASGAEYFEVDRGGSVTYHGPGQLVGYPIVHLDQLGIDPIAFLRALEDALIDACQMRGVDAFREPPFTGVWDRQGKLAALGVKLSGRQVTYHGFALNGTTDLSAFELILPCGIEGRRATSLEAAGASGDLRPEALGELVGPFVAHALGLRWELADAARLGLNLALPEVAPAPGGGRL